MDVHVSAQAAPIAPPAGTPVSGVCSNLPARPGLPSLSGFEDLPASPRCVATGSLPKRKYSVRKFSTRSRASSRTKLSAAGLCRCLDGDMGDETGQASPVEARLLRSSPPPLRRAKVVGSALVVCGWLTRRLGVLRLVISLLQVFLLPLLRWFIIPLHPLGLFCLLTRMST